MLAGYLKNAGALAVAAVISVTGWAFGARILRAQTLSLREREFVVAARARGEHLWRLVLFEILPNERAIIMSGFLLTSVFAVLTQASLAFLGVGSISSWSWGTMLYWAQNAEAFTPGRRPACSGCQACPFAPRCPRAEDDCLTRRPVLVPGSARDRSVACFHPAGLAAEPSSPALAPEK